MVIIRHHGCFLPPLANSPFTVTVDKGKNYCNSPSEPDKLDDDDGHIHDHDEDEDDDDKKKKKRLLGANRATSGASSSTPTLLRSLKKN